MRAGTLHVGEPVVRADGTTATVVGLRVVPGAAAMWDVTVSHVHTFAVGTGAYVVHNCGETGQVGYGSTDLSAATQARRLADGPTIGKTGNYGAARLGDGTIITGRSGSIHAEEDLLNQAQARGQSVVDIYTEREPRAYKCAALTQGKNTSWSWPWNGADTASTQAIRASTKGAINAAVKVLFNNAP